MNPQAADLILQALQKIGIKGSRYISTYSVDTNLEINYPKLKKMEDFAAEYMREQRERILAEKMEIEGYLKIPPTSEGILILTHGRNNMVFVRQKNLPEGQERRIWEYGEEKKTAESGYMTGIDMMGDESATFVCLCKAKSQKIEFALQRGERFFNDYEKISEDGSTLCVLEQTKEKKLPIERKEIDRSLTVQRWKMEFDDGFDLSYTCSNTREHIWPNERLGDWTKIQKDKTTSSEEMNKLPSSSSSNN
jgi:hypothetical protein